jgi:hypothetical protein
MYFQLRYSQNLGRVDITIVVYFVITVLGVVAQESHIQLQCSRHWVQPPAPHWERKLSCRSMTNTTHGKIPNPEKEESWPLLQYPYKNVRTQDSQ